MRLRKALNREGWEPDFPEGIDFLLLADCRSVKWGLYEFSRDGNTEEWIPDSPATEYLISLIESGKKYPPALAISKAAVAIKFENKEPSLSEFTDFFCNKLFYYLSQQSNSNYRLLQAVNDDLGYLSKGEWYWIIDEFDSEKSVVRWISDDFHIYQNPITDFDYIHHMNKT